MYSWRLPWQVNMMGALSFSNLIHFFFKLIVTSTLCVAELILGLRPANEKRRYKVTPSLIGWAQT